MPCKVLVVDDSTFFQSRLKEVIDSHPDLMVVGIANNGQEAVDMARQLQPDVISMDYEMPYMDGVTAVRAIMAQHPVPIVMFSSLTYEGARVTFAALDAGAVDFLPKNFANLAGQSSDLRRKLQESLLFYARKAQAKAAGLRQNTAAHSTTTTAREAITKAPVGKRSQPKHLVNPIQLLVIGASTGGPVAVTEVLTHLPRDFNVPIVVVQHMPANFTKVFAERVNRQCELEVREAKDGDKLETGVALIAPGAQQLFFDRRKRCIRIMAGDERLNYNPSADVAFASAARVFGRHVLAVVLTGMGHDGCQGARLLKQSGAMVWAQDQNSSVVYGMPQAVADAGFADEIVPLLEISTRLRDEFCTLV